MAGYRRGLRLPGAVVVVAGPAAGTGAAGRATADLLAARGARPVLVGDPADHVDHAGGHAVPADLADAASVQEAAGEVVRRCGRIDAWVHVADARAAGPLREVPPEQVRHVLDTGVLGALHGARAALPFLIAQRSGVVVVVASVHGQVARPGAAAQGMAGAAVRVLAAALRQELRLAGVRGVAVTTVLAPELEPIPGPPFPTGSAEVVAATVLQQLRRPRLEKVAGGPVAKAVVHGHALVPGLTEWLVARRSPPGGG